MATTSKPAASKAVKPAAKPATKPKAAPAKPTTTKTAASSVTAPKAAAKPKAAAPVKKEAAAPAKAAPKKSPAKTKITPDQYRAYVEVAAYHIAERRGFASGNAQEDWAQAEAEIDRLLSEGILKP